MARDAKLFAVILAAGLGKRMKSALPKVLHQAAGKPLIRWVADAARGAGASKFIAVVGPEMTDAEKAEHLRGFETVIQRERLGTGHAAQQAAPLLSDADEVLVLCGDVPCISAATLRNLAEARRRDDAAAAVLSMVLDDAGAYGRIIRSKTDSSCVERIVEARDCAPEELAVNEVNSGTYVFRRADLLRGLSSLKSDNAQQEYYLTDVVRDCALHDGRVAGVIAGDPGEMLGVNTPDELGVVERYLVRRGSEV